MAHGNPLSAVLSETLCNFIQRQRIASRFIAAHVPIALRVRVVQRFAHHTTAMTMDSVISGHKFTAAEWRRRFQRSICLVIKIDNKLIPLEAMLRNAIYYVNSDT